jgi:hypothetical protein
MPAISSLNPLLAPDQVLFGKGFFNFNRFRGKEEYGSAGCRTAEPYFSFHFTPLQNFPDDNNNFT